MRATKLFLLLIMSLPITAMASESQEAEERFTYFYKIKPIDHKITVKDENGVLTIDPENQVWHGRNNKLDWQERNTLQKLRAIIGFDWQKFERVFSLIYTTIAVGGMVFVKGSNNGLFIFDIIDPWAVQKIVRYFYRSSGIFAAGDKVLFKTSDGYFIYDGESFRKIKHKFNSPLSPIHAVNGMVVVGSFDGLSPAFFIIDPNTGAVRKIEYDFSYLHHNFAAFVVNGMAIVNCQGGLFIVDPETEIVRKIEDDGFNVVFDLRAIDDTIFVRAGIPGHRIVNFRIEIERIDIEERQLVDLQPDQDQQDERLGLMTTGNIGQINGFFDFHQGIGQ